MIFWDFTRDRGKAEVLFDKHARVCVSETQRKKREKGGWEMRCCGRICQEWSLSFCSVVCGYIKVSFRFNAKQLYFQPGLVFVYIYIYMPSSSERIGLWSSIYCTIEWPAWLNHPLLLWPYPSHPPL